MKVLQAAATAFSIAISATSPLHTEPVHRQVSKPTAREIIAAIQLKIPNDWDAPTVDTFKAGNPDMPVNGIAVTMMATMDVLQRAAAHGENLIITHEPTFFDHLTQAGMEDCANWLKTFIKGLPIEFLATQQPFWTVLPTG